MVTASEERANARGCEITQVRERIAKWMILHSVATGHGDTVEDLLDELDVELSEIRARLAKAEGCIDALRQLADNFMTGWAGDLSRHEIIRKVERIANDALAAYSKEIDLYGRL